MPHQAPSQRYIIDPVAFFAALFGGPILFTLATFWIAFVPVFALAIGGLPYLLIGTPVLLIYLSRRPVQPRALAGLALATVVLLGLLAHLAALIAGREAQAFSIGLITLFGAIFAPCWAASFGWLYTRLARDFYTRPVPIS